MSIRENIRRAGHQLKRLMPHDALCQLPGTPGEPVEDEWGQTLPGTPTPGPVYPCYAARISAEDAVKAGLGSSSDTWRVVVDQPAPITPESTLTVTLPTGDALALTVTQVSGVDRIDALCRRSG
ncbi:hypothetical protein DEIPH_ctg011orf0015 [Deinococcus phoenicis]|uniref:Uncharacterized protein n=1 Tax=Deinococcus phoenicis TaxID=1476583 RepID=A0A016QSV6_9DEIO|nr:hypothetical protein [Deinococcus phoenicis]EYB69051.1 hypothetical protein DEIPH_ctg011orf0015 [Deinococcus phoenicis]